MKYYIWKKCKTYIVALGQMGVSQIYRSKISSGETMIIAMSRLGLKSNNNK